MLTAIQIQNFKSYHDQHLPLAPLTLLIGANAAGKSNALEAFRFLCWLGQGQKLSVLRHRVDDSEQVLRGQVRDLPYLQGKSFTLGCTTDDEDWNCLSVEIALRDDELHIAQESISSKGSKRPGFPLYRVEQASTGLSTDLRVAYNNFARGGQKPQITCTDQIAILNQLASSALFGAGHKLAQKRIPEMTNRFQSLLGKCQPVSFRS